MQLTGWTHFSDETYQEFSTLRYFLKDRPEEEKRLSELGNKAFEVLKAYCIQNKVFISDGEHQNSKTGVPIFDNTFTLEFTLRAWSGFMAEVWNEIENTDKYTYLSFYCGMSKPDTFRKEVN